MAEWKLTRSEAATTEVSPAFPGAGQLPGEELDQAAGSAGDPADLSAIADMLHAAAEAGDLAALAHLSAQLVGQQEADAATAIQLARVWQRAARRLER